MNASIDNSDIMVVYNTHSDCRMFHSAFVAVAKGKPLDEAIADLFNVRVIHNPTAPHTRVIVEAA